MRKTAKRLLAIMLAIVCVFGLAAGPTPVAEAKAASKKTYIIVLDPGHDSSHIGARFNGLVEEDITLKLAKYCKIYLEKNNKNVKVYLTRTDAGCAFGGKGVQTSTCLHARAAFAKKKKADYFISFHVNSSTGTVASGVETYSSTAYMRTEVGKLSHEMATKILAKLVKLGFANRGAKYANWVVCKDTNEYGIPSVLIEHGFIRNASDRRWLSSDDKLKKMALADADGIAEMLGVKKPSASALEVSLDEESEDTATSTTTTTTTTTTTSGTKRKTDSAADEDDEILRGHYYYGDVDDDDDDFDSVRVSEPAYKAVKANSKANSKSKSNTKAAVKLSGIHSVGFSSLQIAWEPYENARGYVVYRRATTGSKKSSVLRKIATVRDETIYIDETCEPATTYQYSVRAFGPGFKTGDQKKLLTKKSASGGVVGFSVSRGIFNSVEMKWQPKVTAMGYEIERANTDSLDDVDDKFGLLTTIEGVDTNSYTDTSAEPATNYKYRIRAFYITEKGKKQYGTYVTKKVKTGNNKVNDLNITRVTQNSVKLSWSAVPRATGYEVCRAKGVGSTDKFTVLGLAENGSRVYVDSEVDLDTAYSYKVRAYVVKDSVTYWGAYSDVERLNNESTTSSKTPIAGSAKTTVEQMVKFYKASGRTYPEEVYYDKGAPTIEAFAKIVYEEAEDEEIRPEVVFAQICKETRYLEFGGDVKAKQCNFAGLGATGDSSKGATFYNVRQGVRAQVQHLKAYANTESLNHSKVDPRFSMVKRGSAPYVEWLGIKENPNGTGWASDKNYGYSLKEDYLDILLGT